MPARSPAGRPGRGAVKAIGAMSAERSEPTDDILGGWPGSTSSVRLVAGIVTSTDKVAIGGCSLRPVAPTVNLGFGTGARSRSPGGADALSKSHSDGWYLVTSRPTPPCDHLRTDAPLARISCGASSLGQRSGEVFEVSLSSMWLAVFKMMHRSGGRQGYGQLLTAFAGLTDRERSPQNFSSALRAPLTLHLSPGAASFQHQPTREETT